MSDEVRNPFGAAGPPVAKFDKIGDAVEGTITRVEYQAERDLEGNLKKFADGSVRPVVVVHLDTVNGPMRDFVKGRSVSSFRHEVHAAEGEALDGDELLDRMVGAKYRREYTSNAKPTGPGRNPEKLFQVDYWSATDDGGDLV